MKRTGRAGLPATAKAGGCHEVRAARDRVYACCARSAAGGTKAGAGGGTASAGSGETGAQENLEEPMGELPARLGDLVGLERVKQEVASLVKLMQMVKRRQEAGLPPPPLSRHLVFAGNPGTGKTTVARLYGQILAALGMLSRGHLVEADRATWSASTSATPRRRPRRSSAGRWAGCCSSTRRTRWRRRAGHRLRPGGHLHAGEADGGPPRRGRGDRAGYPGDMERFIDSNPGLASRFTRTAQLRRLLVGRTRGDRQPTRPSGTSTAARGHRRGAAAVLRHR